MMQNSKISQIEVKKTSDECLNALQRGIDSITDYAIFLLDPQGLVKTWNKGAERIKGYTASEIIGQSFARFYKPEAVEQHYPEHILAQAKAQGCFKDQGWHVRKGGTTFWADVVITPIFDEKGIHTGFVKVIRDLTEHKQAELLLHQSSEELKANKKRLINYIDMFTHGLRNPLTGIQGTNLFIQRDVDNIQSALDEITQNPLAAKEKIAKYLSDIKEQTVAIEACVRHSTIITDDVLDLSRLEANSKKLIIEPFCVQTVLATIGKMFGAAMKEKELEFRLQIPEEELFVKGDPNCLEQVLTNLMTNAIKFTKAGYITLSVIQQETTPGEIVLQFKVEDTGIGMTEDERQCIFNRFKQAHKRVRHDYGGSGLGLYISKQLVKLMGGEITVEAEKGKGSIFTFTIRCLPLSKEEQQQLTQPVLKEEKNETVSSVKVNAPRNILIVEDNLINQKILARQLGSKGYQYQVASNGLEALEKWQATGFDAILMDIEMPKMNGLETTKEIRQQEKLLNRSYTPIIGLSGNARQEQKEEAFGAGMNAYLIKPYEPEKIYQAIEDSLNRHSLKQTEQQNAFFDTQGKSPSLSC